MNQNIHRINDIIKQVPDLRYDASTGWFETDRRALYDFAVLVVQECAKVADEGLAEVTMKGPEWPSHYIKKHFGVEE